MSFQASDRIFCALDTTDTRKAVETATLLKGLIGGVKLGLEYFLANGVKGYEAVAATGMPIFLDLKFHDIPNTVAGAIKAVMPLGPTILTIHTQGGLEQMRRAAETVAEAATVHNVEKPWLVGVTVLTSLDKDDLNAMGVTDDVPRQVERLAGLAQAAGLDGMVCSPKEITLARAATQHDFRLVVPGIRPEGSAIGDQKRVMTPREAVTAGADILVIGRPILSADDPAEAARNIALSLNT